MAAIEPLSRIIGINPSRLTKVEKFFLEMDLFLTICRELSDNFKTRYKNYFYLVETTYQTEKTMLEKNFVSFIINDILSTNLYTIQGIATYTGMSDEVIREVAARINNDPSAILLRRCIELHREVRNELYNEIIKKIMLKYVAVF